MTCGSGKRAAARKRFKAQLCRCLERRKRRIDKALKTITNLHVKHGGMESDVKGWETFLRAVRAVLEELVP